MTWVPVMKTNDLLQGRQTVKDINVSIQKKLTSNFPEPVAELAMKAIAYSEQEGSPSAVAERLKPIIRRLAQQPSGGGAKQ